MESKSFSSNPIFSIPFASRLPEVFATFATCYFYYFYMTHNGSINIYKELEFISLWITEKKLI